MRYLTAPRCHWPACPHSDKTMFLLGETDGFWMFAHGCGTTRALTKPSARAISLYRKYENSIEQERQRQRYLSSRSAFSIPEVRRWPLK